MPGVAIFPADPSRGTCPRARGEAGAATTRDRRQPGRPLADPPARALQTQQPAPPCSLATAASPCLGLATSRLASRKRRLPGPETQRPRGLRREAETGRAAAAGGGAGDAGAAERRYQDARLGARRAREGGHVISPQPSSAPQPSTPPPSNLQLLSPQPNSDPPSTLRPKAPHPCSPQPCDPPQSAALHPLGPAAASTCPSTLPWLHSYPAPH